MCLRVDKCFKRLPAALSLAVEKVERLRVQVAQKDMFISELLDRIAIVECEVRHGSKTWHV